MNWSDSTAIADAAGLHAMTKLEFDKAARGSGAAVAGEYAGGSTRIAANRGFAGAHGSGSERATPADANTSWSPSLQDRQLLGPYSASLAAERATREGCGESYWGVVNLSGNLVELVVMPGLPRGAANLPNHGDGELAEDGHADVAGWPRIEALQAAASENPLSRAFGPWGRSPCALFGMLRWVPLISCYHGLRAVCIGPTTLVRHPGLSPGFHFRGKRNTHADARHRSCPAARLGQGDASAVDRAVRAARQAFEGEWSRWKPYDRQRRLISAPAFAAGRLRPTSTLSPSASNDPVLRSLL